MVDDPSVARPISGPLQTPDSSACAHRLRWAHRPHLRRRSGDRDQPFGRCRDTRPRRLSLAPAPVSSTTTSPSSATVDPPGGHAAPPCTRRRPPPRRSTRRAPRSRAGSRGTAPGRRAVKASTGFAAQTRMPACAKVSASGSFASTGRAVGDGGQPARPDACPGGRSASARRASCPATSSAATSATDPHRRRAHRRGRRPPGRRALPTGTSRHGGNRGEEEQQPDAVARRRQRSPTTRPMATTHSHARSERRRHGQQRHGRHEQRDVEGVGEVGPGPQVGPPRGCLVAQRRHVVLRRPQPRRREQQAAEAGQPRRGPGPAAGPAGATT